AILWRAGTQREKQAIRDPGDEVKQQARAIQQDLRQISRQADTTTIHIPPQSRVFATMRMIEQRGWLIYQPVATCDHLEEGRQILRPLCRGSRSKSHVKASATAQEAGLKGHIRTGAKASRRVWIEGRLRMMLAQIKDAPGETLAKPTKLLKPALRLRLKL